MRIEKGCRAKLVKATVKRNLGKIGVVGNFIGKVHGFAGTDRWEFSEPLIGAFYDGSEPEIIYHARESSLRRIDDQNELSTWEQIQEDTGWSPEVKV